MKLGPIHLIRDATFRRLHQLQRLWDQFSTALTAAARTGNPLAGEVLDHSHGLAHSPLCARLAPPLFTDPTDDAAGRRAAGRVVVAYQRAAADGPAPRIDHRPGREQRDFLAALGRGDVAAVTVTLARMFTTELTGGLGHSHPSHIPQLRAGGASHVHLGFTDTLVSLAEAIGAARVTHITRDATSHLHPLDRDLNALFDATATKLGFDPVFPAVGAAYGFGVSGRLVTTDGLIHAYNAHRLRQLGANSAGTVFEIGGGYGCLALMACRAGIGHYTIFDRPWVNALQGYFLIRTLPEGTVRLYGEDAGDVRVLPDWKLGDEPAKACDLLVNTDSLPEMVPAAVKDYLRTIRHVTRGAFLSVNQEATARPCVAELAAEVGGFEVLSRQRYWMRQGYVEEVYRPA